MKLSFSLVLSLSKDEYAPIAGQLMLRQAQHEDTNGESEA